MTPRPSRRGLEIALSALLWVAAGPAPARAQAQPPGAADTDPDEPPGEPDPFFEDEDDDLFTVEDEINPDSPPVPLTPPETERDRDAWSVSFGGGYAVPIGAFSATRGAGLATSLDATWTTSWGLGGRAAVQYAPMPHDSADDDEPTTRTGHVVAATVAPVYALRVGDLRFWGAAGGALVLERLEIVTATQAMNDEADNSFELGLAGSAVAGIDYLLFTDGGPTASAEVLRSVAGKTYGYALLRAGLAFVF